MTAHELISWARWASEADTDEEKSKRALRIKQHVFPEQLDDEEYKQREEIFEYVRKMGEPPNWDGWPDACEVPDRVTMPSLPKVKWDGLVSPNSPAYRRGSKHDETAEQTKRMRDLAKGSPFDADEDVEVKRAVLKPTPRTQPRWRRE